MSSSCCASCRALMIASLFVSILVLVLIISPSSCSIVKAVFLIAAFANRLDNAHKYDSDYYPDFFEHSIDIESIKLLAERFVVVHSRDDVLDYEQGVEIANQLEAKLITYDDRGHFSDPENAHVVFEVLQKELEF